MLRGIGLLALAIVCYSPVSAEEAASVLDHEMKSLTGKDVDLSKYEGKVVLIVNVASKCGYTPQYKGLQAIHEKYADQGLVILGFPCNQFGKQEPGTPEEIADFCEKNYGVTFDLFAKVDVNGDDACDLYKELTDKEAPYGGPIKWNFEKFLVGKDGKVIERYRSAIKPESPELTGAIEKALAN